MRIASFNVENLFSRVRAMNLDTWSEGRAILAEYSRLTGRLQKPVYNAADRRAIVKSILALGFRNSMTGRNTSEFALLRENHGRLLKWPKPKNAPPEVIAAGRGDWIGWVELRKESVNDTAMEMTARVIRDVNADVLAVVEAEDRVALNHFNEQLLKPANAAYRCVMLIDGNDERGIDVGLMTRGECAIEGMVSHVDDTQQGHRIFSRDCPEYTVRLNDDTTLLVMINHLKSKGYGNARESNERRKMQARRVRKIYDRRRAEGVENIVIVGDFNDTPASDPLKPLLGSGSDLKDISQHPQFQDDGRSGTFANGTASNKIDYILLSPALFAKVQTGGVERRGVWGGRNGTLFPHYPEMTKSIHAASDHAAVWADIDL